MSFLLLLFIINFSLYYTNKRKQLKHLEKKNKTISQIFYIQTIKKKGKNKKNK